MRLLESCHCYPAYASDSDVSRRTAHAAASIARIRVETGYRAVRQKQIFQEKGPVDILFVNSSLMVRGVDMNYVQQQLSQQLGKPPKVSHISPPQMAGPGYAWYMLMPVFSNITRWGWS